MSIQNSKFKMKYFGLLLLFVLCNFVLNSQCAMCKAGAEQSLERGATDVNWINYGILLLMIVPFIIIGGIYWMYRQNKSWE